MSTFSNLDFVALGWFVAAWIAYAIGVERSHYGQRGLNARMDTYREAWVRRMLERDMRMVDMQIMASLHNGTAFFASASLIAVGGALTMLRSTEDVIAIFATLPAGVAPTRLQWEGKVIGLAVIFVYAFFKFAWSYRLFNYVSIMFGAMPPAPEKDTAEAELHVIRTARLFKAAGRHFNRGQRAFFFALAYLGWFISPWLLMATTAAALVVMWRRQYASDSLHAITLREEARTAPPPTIGSPPA
jgi:uncharacterized membrane protein